MFVFYPLPITKDYVRYKRRKGGPVPVSSGPQDRSRFIKNNDSSQREVRVQYIETSKTNVGKTKEHGMNVLDVLQMEKNPVFSVFPKDIIRQKKVAIFHVIDSKRSRKELSYAYNHFLLLGQGTKRLQSFQGMRDKYTGMEHIITNYKHLNSSLTQQNKSANTFFTEGFGKWFMKSMSCVQLNGVPILPVSSGENININHISSILEKTKSALQLEDEAYLVFPNHRWLKLMCWWKYFQTKFLPCYVELQKIFTSSSTSLTVSQISMVNNSVNEMNATLRTLMLDRADAEFVACDIYIDLPLGNPKIDCWNLTELPRYFNRKDFHQAVDNDSKWFSFIIEASEMVIHIVASVLEIIKSDLWKNKMPPEIEPNIIHHIQEFYDFTIRNYQPQVQQKPCIDLMRNRIISVVEEQISNLQGMKHNSKDGIKTNTYEDLLQLPIGFVSSFLDAVINAIANNALRGMYQNPDDRKNAVHMIQDRMQDVKFYGQIFALKCIHNDFLNPELIDRLRKQELTLSKRMLLVRDYAEIAHCILLVFKLIYGEIHWTEVSIPLPYGYCRHDFLAFLQEVHNEDEPFTIVSESIHSVYCQRYKDFVKTLNNDLLNYLRNMTMLANTVEPLILKSKNVIISSKQQNSFLC